MTEGPSCGLQQKSWPQARGGRHAQPSLFWLSSGPYGGQTAPSLLWSPSDQASSQSPGKGLACDPLFGGRSVFSLLQGKALSPRLWAGWLHFLATNHGLWPLRRQREGDV